MRAIIGGMKTTITYALLVALLFSAFAPDAARAKSAPPEEGAAAKVELIHLPPLMVPLLKGSQVVKYTVLKIDLEPAAEADTEALARDLPRARDAILRETYLFAKETAGAQNLDMEALRARLLPAINAALGQNKIAAMYFAGATSIKG